MENHFEEATKSDPMSSTDFWDLVQPFISNKGGPVSSDIPIARNDTIVTDDQELKEIFNDHYVNIIEKSSGKKPSSLASDAGISDDHQIVSLILDKSTTIRVC